MRNWLIAPVALVALETAALACSCLATDDPAELRRLAPDAAQGAVALVEVETVQSYAESNGAGEQVRVVRTIAGSAPPRFRVQRTHLPSSASCDILYEPDERYVMILYPAAGSTYRVSGLCTAHLLDKPAFVDAVTELIGPGRAGERG